MWAIALAASLLGNVVIFGLAGLASIDSEKFRKNLDTVANRPPPETSVTISPEMIQKIQARPQIPDAPAVPPRPATKPQFTNTSEDQRGKRPDHPAFIGERDTEATSDATPNPNARPMPAQKGEKPRSENDIETTQSQYQDGRLKNSPQAPPDPAMKPAPEVPPAPETAASEPAAATPATPAMPPAKTIGDKTNVEVQKPTELLQGQNPVDVNVPKPTPEQSPPPTPATPETQQTAKSTEQKPPAPRKPVQKLSEPAFRGNQKKTALQGSISRTGRSSLDVVDSPLGRYQAAISRAVELEWQRNCVRNRDYITPGFLTVRFSVESSGKVKSVEFVNEGQTGQIQKGFTLNSIRDAEIPAMPKEVSKDLGNEPLELTFNFYF